MLITLSCGFFAPITSFLLFLIYLSKQIVEPNYYCVSDIPRSLLIAEEITNTKGPLSLVALSCGSISWLTSAQVVQASEDVKMNAVYEIGELFELGIQLSYLLILLGLLGVGTFFVIRQVLVRRELDLSAKELQVRTTIFLLYYLLLTSNLYSYWRIK